MRLPMMARSTHAFVPLLAAGLLLAGCQGESTAPPAVRSMAATSQTSPFVASGAPTTLGGTDSTYQFTVDPTIDQSVSIGSNYLSIPANAICALATSSYGASTWNNACDAQTAPVTITAVVRNAATDHPSIDFSPAMRFNPGKNVNLYISNPIGMNDPSKHWVMKYCSDVTNCVDESLADSDLKSSTDLVNKKVFRRIKHFSGYLVNYLVDPITGLPI